MSEIFDGEKCTCSPDKFSKDCPWARSFGDEEPLGHVRNCPLRGGPCPCLEGSIAQAYCYADARTLVVKT